VRVKTTTGTSYNDTGLVTRSSYNYRVTREGWDWEPKGLFGSRKGDNSFTNNQSSQITITKRGRGERIQNGRYLLDGNNAPFLIIGDARPTLS
jgi:hypothetical protein